MESGPTSVERVTALVAPLLADLGLEVYDIEHQGGTLRILVDTHGDTHGVSLDQLTTATRLVSRALDDQGALPASSALEVSSPGLERPLRTPAHYAMALGSEVSIKTLPAFEGPRRMTGVLVTADSQGASVRTADGTELHFGFGDVARGPHRLPLGSHTPYQGQQQANVEAESASAMNNPDLIEALQALAADKGVSPETLIGALADALESAYKRMPEAHEFSWVTIDPDSGEIRVFAQDLDEDGEPVGDDFDVTPDDFGRIAAQTARQVMGQRIREVEREMKYEEYAGREGDIVTGIIQQSDSRYTLLDLGRVEALLPQAEQVPYERPEPNSRLKAYIVEVRRTAKGPQIVVSRTHPGLIKRLFELGGPRDRRRHRRARRPAPVSPGTAPRSPSGPTTPTSIRWARAWGHGEPGCGWSSTSYGARRSTSSPSATTQRTSWPRPSPRPRSKRCASTPISVSPRSSCPDYQLSLAIGKEGQNARLAARSDRLAGRHQVRDPTRRGGRVRQRRVGSGRVDRRS